MVGTYGVQRKNKHEFALHNLAPLQENNDPKTVEGRSYEFGTPGSIYHFKSIKICRS